MPHKLYSAFESFTPAAFSSCVLITHIGYVLFIRIFNIHMFQLIYSRIFCIILAITAPAIMISSGQSYVLCACLFQTIEQCTMLDVNVLGGEGGG